MSTVRLRVNIEDIIRAADGFERYFNFSARELVEQLADSVSERLRSDLSAHDRTGHLSGSVHKYPMEAMGWKFTQHVSVGGPTAPYARMFFEGTQPSPGRYLPFFDRRYSKEFTAAFPERVGWHPGTPSHWSIWENVIIFAQGEIERLRSWIRAFANEYV